MSEEKKSRKSKVRWVVALIVALGLLVGGGWWLWGKGLKRKVGAEGQAGKRLVQPVQKVSPMPTPGRDEDKLAEAEKEQKQEAGNQELSLPPEQARKVPGMITYKKRVIREFKWNEGVDSLHWMNVDGGSMGPNGILVNKQGNVYIYDIDDNCKIISPNGKLVRVASSAGSPLGIDGNGNIILTHNIYDSNMFLIKSYGYPAFLPSDPDYKYISDDGKAYFMISDVVKGNNYHFYRCDPYSNELRIDDEIAKANPGKPPFMVIPCDIIEPDKAPSYLRISKQFEERDDSQNIIKNGIYYFTIDNVNYHIYIGDYNKPPFSQLLSMDNSRNLYIGYEYHSAKYNHEIDRSYNIAVINANGDLIGQVRLCNSPDISLPGGIFRYVYIEPYSEKIYQLCGQLEERNLSLIVWEGMME